MKRLLSLLLVIAMLFGVCTMFAACDSSSSVSDKDDDDDDKKKEEKKKTFQGITIGLPKAYKEEDGDDDYVLYSNGKYEVYVSYRVNEYEEDDDDLQEEYEEQIEEALDEGYFEEGDAGKTDEGTRYIYAVLAEEPSAIAIAFYTTDNSIWEVQIRNAEDNEKFDIEEMIGLITDWEYSDPKPEEDDEDEDEDDKDNERPGNEDARPEESPTQSAPIPSAPRPNFSISNLRVELYDGWNLIYSDHELLEYESEDYILQVQFAETGHTDPEEMMYDYLEMLELQEDPEWIVDWNIGYGHNAYYLYAVNEYGYCTAYGFYVIDGYSWLVTAGNYYEDEYDVDYLIESVTCHYLNG